MNALLELTDLGVSIWLDDLDRHRITSGNLAGLIENKCVRGVTTNPAIFDKAVSAGAEAYAAQINELAAQGKDVDQIIRRLTTDDVRAACDLFTGLWQQSGGVDGRVSIEVDPRLANDTTATMGQARELWTQVARPNVLIKIPATKAGLPAITEAVANGISVNVTLIFAVDRYLEVIAAYEDGLVRAKAAGHDLSAIQSVASFFVSRVDAAVDARLEAIGTPAAQALKGDAAIANARLAWVAYEEALAAPRWAELAECGANPQRPLWASTGVKDPSYDDTRYVVDLATSGCVNTMPEATLEAVGQHGHVIGDTVRGTGSAATSTWQALAELGINQGSVCEQLEVEGVQKFIDSWEQLRRTVQRAMQAPE